MAVGPLVRVDTKDLGALGRAFDEMGGRQRKRVVVRALNRVGDQAYTRVVRVLSSETGAKVSRVRNAVKKFRATQSGRDVAFRIAARDQFMALKDFNPVQRKKGVSANPWKNRRIFAHTFIGPNGHVYKRTGKFAHAMRGARKGKRRETIEKLWGPAIPREMVRGAAFPVVKALVASAMPQRIIHETRHALAEVKARHRL